jgi:hypothetical protein
MSELMAMFCDLILRGKEKMSEDTAQVRCPWLRECAGE